MKVSWLITVAVLLATILTSAAIAQDAAPATPTGPPANPVNADNTTNNESFQISVYLFSDKGLRLKNKTDNRKLAQRFFEFENFLGETIKNTTNFSLDKEIPIIRSDANNKLFDWILKNVPSLQVASTVESDSINVSMEEVLLSFLNRASSVTKDGGPIPNRPWADSNSFVVIVARNKEHQIILDIRDAISKVTIATSAAPDSLQEVWNKDSQNYAMPFLSLNLYVMRDLVPTDTITFLFNVGNEEGNTQKAVVVRTDRTQLYSTSSLNAGLWVPIGLFGLFFDDWKDGLPIAVSPVSLAWGYKIYLIPQKADTYIGLSTIVGWSIATSQRENSDENGSNESYLTNFSTGLMGDFNNIINFGGGHMWNPAEGIDDRGWFIIIGFHSDLLGKTSSVK